MIVAGGGGVGSKDNFRLIHDLAGVIGGAVGASRAAVDSGFIAKDHQVGQTGTTVRPPCISPAASAARCSTARAWKNPRRSSPSTGIARRRSSAWRTTASSAT